MSAYMSKYSAEARTASLPLLLQVLRQQYEACLSHTCGFQHEASLIPARNLYDFPENLDVVGLFTEFTVYISEPDGPLAVLITYADARFRKGF